MDEPLISGPTEPASHPRYDRSALVLWSSAGGLMLAAIVWAVLVGHASAQEPAGDPTKWRPLWDTLVPLLQHPRCLNCHGATDPFVGEEGINHEGGRAETGQCTNCHTARGENGQAWDHLAPADRSFVDKDAAALCRLVKRERAPFAIVTHARVDPLIGFAFAGTKAIDDESPFAPVKIEPPEMGRDRFIDLLQRWIMEAGMGCGMSGTIVYDENQTLTRTSSTPRADGRGTVPTTTRNTVRAAATVNIERDRATTNLDYEATQSSSTQPYDVGSCRHIDDRSSYQRGRGSADTTLPVDLRPDGSYTIRVELAPIQGVGGGQNHVAPRVEGCVDPGVMVTPERPGPVSPLIVMQLSGQAQRNERDGSMVLTGSRTEPLDGGSRVTSWTINID